MVKKCMITGPIIIVMYVENEFIRNAKPGDAQYAKNYYLIMGIMCIVQNVVIGNMCRMCVK